MVIDLDRGDRGAGISLISGARIKIGSKYIKSRIVKNTYTHILPECEGKHVVDINLDAIRVLDGKINDKKVELFWSKDDQKLVDSLFSSNDFIHIHPFSRAPWKEINIKILAKIIDYCELELGRKVVITSAPNKRELKKTKNLVSICKSKPVDLSGKFTLKQTAALNKKAKLFIGVDTAIMHISSANNTPVFALFGPSAVDNWGPWDNDSQLSTYVRAGGLQRNGRHMVYSESLDCIGCNKHGCNDSLISNCLNIMDVNSIKKNIKLMIVEKREYINKIQERK
jgi:heptosyltransferase-3